MFSINRENAEKGVKLLLSAFFVILTILTLNLYDREEQEEIARIGS